jgi:hypothetical protein
VPRQVEGVGSSREGAKLEGGRGQPPEGVLAHGQGQAHDSFTQPHSTKTDATVDAALVDSW